MKKIVISLLAILVISLAGCAQNVSEDNQQTPGSGITPSDSLTFQMSGPSMTPTINDGELIKLEKTSDFQRGDIVIYTNPYDKDQRHVHRIIGLPGETIKLEEGNVVLINRENPNGLVLEEDYLNDKSKGNTYPGIGEGAISEYKLPNNGYFVLGDNRTSSTDSRSCFRDAFNGACGPEDSQFYITKNNIIGKVADIKKFESDIKTPPNLSGIENFGIPKDVVNPQIQIQLKDILENDGEYELLANYMTENYDYDISNASFITNYIDTTQYIGISSDALYKSESNNKEFAIFVALFPVDGSLKRDGEKQNYYYIEEHTEKGMTMLYVEDSEIKKFVMKEF